MQIRKLVLNKAMRLDALFDLRYMNVDRASLFPGLDGFAQSLWLKVMPQHFPEAGMPPIDEIPEELIAPPSAPSVTRSSAATPRIAPPSAPTRPARVER